MAPATWEGMSCVGGLGGVPAAKGDRQEIPVGKAPLSAKARMVKNLIKPLPF